MALSDVILRVVGETDPAERDLNELAGRLNAFDKQKAEAELELDATQLKRELREAKAQLRALEAVTVTPEIDVATKRARAEIAALEAKLARLAARSFDVDVDIDPDGTAQAALAGLTARAAAGGGRFNRLGQAVRDTGSVFRGVLVPALISLVGTLIPAIFSLSAATGALGALTVAAAGGLAGIAAAAIPAVFAVKDLFAAQSEYNETVDEFGRGSEEAREAQKALTKAQREAGPGARALVSAWEDLKDALEGLKGTGAQAILRGLAVVLREVTGSVKDLKPAFDAMGKALGTALRDQAPRVGELVRGFGALTKAAAPLAGPLVSALVSIGQILINIARAAMPTLIRGTRSVAESLERWARQTSDLSAVRAVINDWMKDLRQVGRLTKELGLLFAALFGALKTDGRSVVQQITQLVRGWRQFAESVRGQEQIRQFFQRTFFSIEDLGRAFNALIPLIALWAESLGVFATNFLRLITPIVELLSSLPGPLDDATLGFIGFGLVFGRLAALGTNFVRMLTFLRVGTLAAAAAQWALNAAMLANPIGLVVVAIAALIAIIVVVLAKTGLLGKAWDAVKTALTATWNFLKGLAKRVFGLIEKAAKFGLLGPIPLIISRWKEIKGILGAIWNALKAAATAAFKAILSAARSIFGALKSAVSSILRALVGVARGAWNALKSAAVAAFRGVLSAAKSIFGAVKGAIAAALRAAVGVVKGIAGAFFDAGKAIIQALVNGIKAGAGAVADAVKGVIDKAKSLLPFSEPKDPTSPLRDLDRSGRAIIENLISGIRAGGGELAAALSRELQLALPPVRVEPGMALAGAGSMTQNFNVTTPAVPGRPDPRVIAAQLALLERQRGRGRR